jgi:uncharacterized protein YqgV (UPF0045/DUF77 family)
MKITVEISLYPLKEAFGSPIIDFISELKRKESLIIKTNSLSTQITGDYDEVMNHLKDVLKKTFDQGYKATAIMKIFNEGLELEWLAL